jgi:Mn-dependent DtxR family transcriptional regulator
MTPLQAKIVHALRTRVDMHNKVKVPFEEIAQELGVIKSEVNEALIDLRNDGFFPGTPSLSAEQFCGRLPS